jgi:hypothetical protein
MQLDGAEALVTIYQCSYCLKSFRTWTHPIFCYENDHVQQLALVHKWSFLATRTNTILLPSLPPMDDQHGQEGPPCNCRKIHGVWLLRHNIICHHPPNLHGRELIEDKQKVMSIGCAPTFCIHVNQVSLHKDMILTTTLNNLPKNIHALFKSNWVDSCIQHPHKGNIVLPHTFLSHLLG